ncbi:ROK family protein [Arthrobacter sp. D1-29]
MVLNTSKHSVIAIDVGGTDIKTAVLDRNGELLAVQRTPTPTDHGATKQNSATNGANTAGELVLGRAEELVREHQEAGIGKIAAVGLVVPGLVDEPNGIGLYSANLGWRDFPFRERLENRIGLPVAFGHDVGAAAEAEFRLGAGRGFADVLVMVLGTGGAGAVFADGRRVRGGGYAGEIGHAQVPWGSSCRCGAESCLETVASARSIVLNYRRRSGRSAANAQEVVRQVELGDRHALGAWSEATDALAHTIRQCCSILGIEAVIIGGGLAESGETLLAPVRRKVLEGLSFHRRPQILKAELGQDAGLIGSGLLARDLADQALEGGK